jgi:hypothetical protein
MLDGVDAFFVPPNASDQRPRNGGREPAVKRSAASDGWADSSRCSQFGLNRWNQDTKHGKALLHKHPVSLAIWILATVD